MAEKVDRLTRVNELLKRELAEDITRGLISAPGMLVSVTEVRSSVDLRNATVCISIFGGTASDKERVMQELDRNRIEFQRSIASKLGFKHTPVLYFKRDFRQEKGDRVLEILNGAENDDSADA
ncbi:MAG: 30S ribosome-binding factor RbfA [Lentisphaeria bacterium]|nr:30S ribosome-binding factor RbfA [Lentisphaeria bacterium]